MKIMGMPIVKLPKERLRYTRKGWLRHWLTMVSGSVDIRSGRVIPDEHGCTSRELWVGPFSTAAEAMRSL